MAEVKTEPFDVGDQVFVFAEFVGANGLPANPTDATLQIEKPDGTELATIHIGAMANPVVGRLEYGYVIADPLRHYFRWASSGAFTIAKEGSFGVSKNRLQAPAP